MEKNLSYAKINLGLKILNKRPDGYHNIKSYFIEIDFSDELIFYPNKNYKLSIINNCPKQFPLNENNIITKAYKLLKSYTNKNKSEYLITIKKKYPYWSRVRWW